MGEEYVTFRLSDHSSVVEGIPIGLELFFFLLMSYKVYKISQSTDTEPFTLFSLTRAFFFLNQYLMVEPTVVKNDFYYYFPLRPRAIAECLHT